jgi:hypothetical protein
VFEASRAPDEPGHARTVRTPVRTSAKEKPRFAGMFDSCQRNKTRADDKRMGGGEPLGARRRYRIVLRSR